MENEIINRVAQSALISLDLDDYIPDFNIVEFDFQPILFQGMILREKDLRDFVREHDWSRYKGKDVYVHSSADSIIPTWAFMLVISKLASEARHVIAGTKRDLIRQMVDKALDQIDLEQFNEAKVVIKGCGSLEDKEFAYSRVTEKLISRVSSLMYGEPCSTVPVFKKPRKKS